MTVYSSPNSILVSRPRNAIAEEIVTVKGREPPAVDATDTAELLRRGVLLEYVTMAWNSIGSAITLTIAAATDSPALAALGLASLAGIIEAWIVLIKLKGAPPNTQQSARRLMGFAFLAIAACLLTLSMWVVTGTRTPEPSGGGMAWSAASIVVMLLVAHCERSLGRRLGHRALANGARFRVVSAALAAAVTLGLGANAAFAWWWADPAAALVVAACSLHLGLATLET
jgi:divalent metal cation (Fe/Co/Zn/Cd) transporter